MKRLLCLLLAALLTLLFTASAFAVDIDLSSLSEKELKQLKGQIDKELARRASANSLFSGSIDDYHILGVETAKDMFGAEAILINFLFKNNGKKSASFWMDVSVKVYQDGVECSETYTMDSLSDMTKDIQAGASLEFSKAYTLNNDYDDITIEISKGYALFNNSVPALSFTIELP